MSITINYSRFPNAEEILQAVVGMNAYPSDESQQEALKVAAAAAADSVPAEFEKETGWHPFLSTGEADESRTYPATLNNGMLMLDDGLLSLTSISAQGQSIVIGSQAWGLPRNAVARGSAFSMIQFTHAVPWYRGWPYPFDIVVTGEWGRVRTVPPDVWMACLRQAAYMCLSGGNQDQDVVERSKNGFSEQYDQVGVIDPKKQAELLPKEFAAAIRRWKRVGVG